MRQVDRDELVSLLAFAIQQLPASTRAMMLDARPEQQRKGRFFAAQQIAAKLERWEILSGAPPPPPMRFADFEGGSGVPAADA